MKKLSYIALFCLLIFLPTGCDFFRKMAGRPTSAEIEEMRATIEAERAAHEATLDTLDRLRRVADSLAAVDAARKASPYRMGHFTAVSAESLPYRYYIIVGAFAYPENAERCAARLLKQDLSPTLIHGLNRLIAVGIYPTNSLDEARSIRDRVRESGISRDAWILYGK